MYDSFEIDSPTRSWFVDESVCDLPVSWYYLISGGQTCSLRHMYDLSEINRQFLSCLQRRLVLKYLFGKEKICIRWTKVQQPFRQEDHWGEINWRSVTCIYWGWQQIQTLAAGLHQYEVFSLIIHPCEHREGRIPLESRPRWWSKDSRWLMETLSWISPDISEVVVVMVTWWVTQWGLK